MHIKLPTMPFKFDSPEGRMEVIVRSTTPGMGEPVQFSGAVAFMEAGPRALQRIPLAARSDSYSGAIKVLTQGFKVSLPVHGENTAEFRVLTALCTATGVVEIDA